MDGPLLHVDCDAFFASVEQRDDPSLASVPMAVGDVVVACANYPARAIGVHAGSSMTTTLRQFPQLVAVAPRYTAYEEASKDLFALLEEVARAVEAGSMEEAFLLVPGLEWAAAGEFVLALQERVGRELGLPVSIGVGRTKLIAKLASRAAKPGGVRVIDPEQEARLRPGLPVTDLWGIGPRTPAALSGRGITTVADLAELDLNTLCTVAGTAMGRRLHAIATATDDAVVRPRGEKGPKRSISAQRTLSSAVASDVRAAAHRLADTVAGRLAESGLATRRLTLTAFTTPHARPTPAAPDPWGAGAGSAAAGAFGVARVGGAGGDGDGVRGGGAGGGAAGPDEGAIVLLPRAVHLAADLIAAIDPLLRSLPVTPAGVRLVVDRLEPADAGGQLELELPGLP